jgi:amino acid transporter
MRSTTLQMVVTVMAVIAFVVPSALFFARTAAVYTFGYVGTLAAVGFLVPYFLITIAAPVYLSRLGQLRKRDIACCAIALLLLLVPTVGSVYPLPPAPVVYFPYLFLANLGVGAT